MNLRRYSTFPDRRVAAEAALGAVLTRTGGRFLRRRVPASMEDLAALTPEPRSDPRELLAAAPWFPGDQLETIQSEYDELLAELEGRYQTHTLRFPTIWAVERGTAFLLYALVRQLRPALVLEIGVANGASSFFILRALKANGHGEAHSFDLVPDAGSLLADEERALWHFHVISRRRTLRDYLGELPEADLCFHDADHEYLAQLREFSQFWEQLGDDGILVGDDIDASYAWIDFCGSIRKQPEVLIDRRKAVGLLAKSAPVLGNGRA